MIARIVERGTGKRFCKNPETERFRDFLNNILIFVHTGGSPGLYACINPLLGREAVVD
jgi:hypothetical protein